MRTRLGVSIVVGLGLLGGCGAGPFSSLDDTESGSSDDGQSSTGSSSTGSSSASEVTGESTSSDPSTATTSVFVPDEDTYEGEGGWCDPWAQDCPEGEKCAPYASVRDVWDSDTCVAITGSQTVGQPCFYDGPGIGSDDCDAASACWNALPLDTDLIGTCFAFCSGSADDSQCPDPLTSCRISNGNSIALCLPTCDPLLQACEPGLGCYWSQSSEDFHCVGVSTWMGAEIATGEPCGYNNDCAPGNFCADADAVEGCLGSQCCASFCSLAQDPSPCTDGSTCIPFFADGTAPAIYADLGLCVVNFADPLNQPDAW